MHRDLERDAKAKRELARELLSNAESLELLAEMRATAPGVVLCRLLDKQIDDWQRYGSWGMLDAEAVREQGKALRSRELLEYLMGAHEEAKRQRAEAERLISLLETAADQGRIARG